MSGSEVEGYDVEGTETVFSLSYALNMLKVKVQKPECCDCDHYLPLMKHKLTDCWHSGCVDFSNLQFHAHSCPRGKLVSKEFKCSRTVKVSKYRHDRIKWHMGEINKHMQDLTAEFEELFDPYLPIASKLKIKPGMGTIEFSEAEPGFNLEIPSTYHGKWKLKVGCADSIEMTRDDKCVTVGFDIVE